MYYHLHDDEKSNTVGELLLESTVLPVEVWNVHTFEVCHGWCKSILEAADSQVGSSSTRLHAGALCFLQPLFCMGDTSIVSMSSDVTSNIWTFRFLSLAIWRMPVLLVMLLPCATASSAVLLTTPPIPSAGPFSWPASEKFQDELYHPILTLKWADR